MTRVRRLAGVAVLFGALAGGADGVAPARAHAPALTRRDPILFVHGWRGRAEQWRLMMSRFRRDGWTERELFAWTVDTREAPEAAARRIAARVDQILAATGAERVDLVTHSMGGLPARYYLRALGGVDRVDAWVSLGGPNHGTAVALLCFSDACRAMWPGSRFLDALNHGDETPGQVRYATWGSPCDEIIDPPGSVALQGAANHRTGCLSHLDLLRDTAVYRGVRDHVAGAVR